MGIIFAVSSIFMMIAFGIGDGMIPIISYNYGAKNPERIRETIFSAMIVAIGISIVIFLLMGFFPAAIAGFFVGRSSPIIEPAATALRLFAVSVPFYSFQIIGSRYLQAINCAKSAILSVILRQLVIFIPVIYLLTAEFGALGVWLAFPATDLAAAVITGIMIKVRSNGLKLTDESIILKQKRA